VTPETPLYGRRQARGGQLWAEPPVSAYAGQTYYGRPAIKPSHYKWLITCYLFVGGIAGASQIIAAVADLFGGKGDRGVVRGGRYLALLGSLLSPIFLIRDLQTPKRFYNMLRIFRPTSPMSIGSWTLAAFGTLSGLTAAAQFLDDLTGASFGRWLARLAGLPAAAAGMIMSCYTGSLLSATSVPFWASVYRLLPPLFGTSAMSTGAAATSLAMDKAGVSEEAHASLERIALVAGAAELALTIACNRQWKQSHTGSPLERKRGVALAYRFGVLGLGILVPLVIHAIHVFTGRRAPWASKLADISALTGGFIQRAALTFGGNDSASRPEDYFRFTQPGPNGKVAV
jgi:formate-dependent nitrite reductase membrane component NrfD